MQSFTTTAFLFLASSVAADSSAHVGADTIVNAPDNNSDDNNLRRRRDLQTISNDSDDDRTICYESGGAFKDFFCDTFKTLADGTHLQIKEKKLTAVDNAAEESPFCVGWSLDTDCSACFVPGEVEYPCPVEGGQMTYDCSNISDDICAKVDCAGNCVNVPTSGAIVACFSGITTVTVKDKGVITMDSLKLGDEVLTTTGAYEPVYSFGHRDESTVGKFLQLLPSKLELSEDHMVFMENGKAIPASMVKVGDRLSLGQEVTAIKAVQRQGLYAPFTPSGSILVNGIQASNYIAFQKDSDTLMVGSSYSTGLTFHWVAHKFQLPHRTWCSITNSCDHEAYNSDGISKWVAFQHHLFQWFFHPDNVIVMAFLTVPLVLLIGALAVAEFLLTPAVAATLAIAFLFVSRKRETKSKSL